jgi:hypothetical protein
MTMTPRTAPINQGDDSNRQNDPHLDDAPWCPRHHRTVAASKNEKDAARAV